MDYILHIFVLIGIYSILSISLNLIVGYTGFLSITHAAFYGVGAYTVAIMALTLQSSFFINILGAIILSALLGALVGLPSLRLKGDYFVIACFAFQVIVFDILNNWTTLTHGPQGITGIPNPELFGLQISSHFAFFLLVFLFTCLIFLVSYRLVSSPFGRVLKAIREDEIFAESMGKNTAIYKVLIFAIAAGMAAVAGAMFSYYTSYISPSSFSVSESIFIISLVIVGGAGSLWGSVIGAIVLVTLPEFLRFVGLPVAIASNARQIIYGVLLVLFIMYRPHGLLGNFSLKEENSTK
jgi:branched-chain amino acid transport system permease protein